MHGSSSIGALILAARLVLANSWGEGVGASKSRSVAEAAPAPRPDAGAVVADRSWAVRELYPHDGHLTWTEHGFRGADVARTVVGDLDLRTNETRTRLFEPGLHGLAALGGELWAFSEGCHLQRVDLESGALHDTGRSYPFPCVGPKAGGLSLYFAVKRGDPMLFRFTPGKSSLRDRSAKSRASPTDRIDLSGLAEASHGVTGLVVDGPTLYISTFGPVYRVRGWSGRPERIAEGGDEILVAQNRTHLFVGALDRGEVMAIPKSGRARPRKVCRVRNLAKIAASETELFSVDGESGEIRAWNLEDGSSEVIGAPSQGAPAAIATADGRLFWATTVKGADGSSRGSQILVSERPPRNRGPEARSRGR